MPDHAGDRANRAGLADVGRRAGPNQSAGAVTDGVGGDPIGRQTPQQDRTQLDVVLDHAHRHDRGTYSFLNVRWVRFLWRGVLLDRFV